MASSVFVGHLLIAFLIIIETEAAIRLFSANRKIEADPIQCQIKREIKFDAMQFITSKGYEFEEHAVQTKDNYVLKIHSARYTSFRIPRGLNHGADDKRHRPAVFLQHGLLGSSEQWVINSASESLGYILADAGFDVWIGNIRGNTYSRNNTELKPEDKRFWDFSFHEMSMYDLPAMIDYVYSETGQQKLFYVGHSQGTLIAFLQFARDPKWTSERIIQFHAMSPVVYLKTITSPIRNLAPFTKFGKHIFQLFGMHEFMSNKNFISWFAENNCFQWPLGQDLCNKLLHAMKEGFNPDHTDMARLPIYAARDPAGTSSKNIIHFAQMIQAKRLQHYDHGTKKNSERYGTQEPPEYSLKQFSVPTAFYWGGLDALADPQDVALLYDELKPHIISNVGFDKFHHLDFVFGINTHREVYPKMLELMNKAANH